MINLYSKMWVIVVVAATILIKENSCLPSIRPLSQRGIIFPDENWDDCFLDEASTEAGVCKTLQQCPDVVKKWDNENIIPKTCYFIKKEQFVCCPINATQERFKTTEKPVKTTKSQSDILIEGIFNTDPAAFTLKPFDLNNEITTTKKPMNIFLDNWQKTTTTTTKRPSNIFLDKVKKPETTTKMPSEIIPGIFDTEKPFILKRRSQIECDLQNQQNFAKSLSNGQPTNPNEFPFTAALGFKRPDNKIWYPCGGVLISPKFVLTAAHCSELGGEHTPVVQLGNTNLTDSETDALKVKHFIKHPDYNVSTIANDIALVELENEVDLPTACIWPLNNLTSANLVALGYGFGRIGPQELLKAPLTVIDKNECQQLYKKDEQLKTTDILDSQLCAGDIPPLKIGCRGDTGGPLIMEADHLQYVVGITAFSLGCADLPPSIYTRVSAFIDWIEPIVWPTFDVRFDRK